MIDLLIRNALERQGITLPGPEYSLAGVPSEGRLDVIASNHLASLASDNPISNALFQTVRPFVDGYLVSQIGPSRVKEMVETLKGQALGQGQNQEFKPRKKKKSKALVRRSQ